MSNLNADARQHDPYTHANPFFVSAVLESRVSAAILDVGCWNGTLGRVLAHVPGMAIDGVERDREQAEHARRTGYRTVYCLDLNLDSIRTIDRQYDFIFFGDVLEHLQNPLKILQDSRALLSPNGKTLVSLPNIAFLTCRLNHLLGRWNYADYGIMDRTHLRFFTKRSMIELLREAGYDVEWIEGYVGLSGYPWIIRAPLRWLGKVWPSLFAIQIVASAKSSPNAINADFDQVKNRGQP